MIILGYQRVLVLQLPTRLKSAPVSYSRISVSDTPTGFNQQQSLILRAGLFLAALLLIVGLFSPMMTMSKFYFFESSFSVLGGINQLFLEGHVLLAILVAIFSVLIPIGKLIFLFLLSGVQKEEIQFSSQRKKYLKLMHDYGRWAMLDVLVVAVLIVTVKLGAVASVEVHWGLYVFSAAVFLIMYLTHRISKQLHE